MNGCWRCYINDNNKVKCYKYHRITKNGINALKTALGVTGTLKFLEQFDNGGSGDYTAEKYEHEETKSSDAEIREMFGF